MVNRPRCLFVSLRALSCAMSQNGISYFRRKVIHEAGTSREVGVPVCAHSIRGIVMVLSVRIASGGSLWSRILS